MKRVALFVTLVSLVGTACKEDRKAPKPGPAVTGSAADPWTQPTAKKDPLPRPFFYSLEKDGKTSYVIGTMHRGVDAETRLPQIVWDKLAASPTFATEADLSHPALAGITQREQGTLSAELGPEYWKKLETAIGADMARQLDHSKAMAAATFLSLKYLPPTVAMDAVLLGRAMNQNKKLVYLESALDDAKMLEKHMDARMLKMMLDTDAKAPEQAKKMLDAYLAGNGDGLLELNDTQRVDALAHGFTAAEYDASIDDLLYKRNASWVAPIEELHDAGGGFIAVGALHLVGKRSVLELLEAKGFKVTRITP
jgi:uncharacterized protein YbaP (TraB family)